MPAILRQGPPAQQRPLSGLHNAPVRRVAISSGCDHLRVNILAGLAGTELFPLFPAFSASPYSTESSPQHNPALSRSLSHAETEFLTILLGENSPRGILRRVCLGLRASVSGLAVCRTALCPRLQGLRHLEALPRREAKALSQTLRSREAAPRRLHNFGSDLLGWNRHGMAAEHKVPIPCLTTKLVGASIRLLNCLTQALSTPVAVASRAASKHLPERP